MEKIKKITVWHKTSELPEFYPEEGMNIGGRLVLVATQQKRTQATPQQQKELRLKLKSFSHWCYLSDLVHASYENE